MRDAVSADLSETVARLRSTTNLPICVGFGISDATQAAAVATVLGRELLEDEDLREFEDDLIDLESVVRDAVVLALPYLVTGVASDGPYAGRPGIGAGSRGFSWNPSTRLLASTPSTPNSRARSSGTSTTPTVMSASAAVTAERSWPAPDATANARVQPVRYSYSPSMFLPV